MVKMDGSISQEMGGGRGTRGTIEGDRLDIDNKRPLALKLFYSLAGKYGEKPVLEYIERKTPEGIAPAFVASWFNGKIISPWLRQQILDCLEYLQKTGDLTPLSRPEPRYQATKVKPRDQDSKEEREEELKRTMPDLPTGPAEYGGIRLTKRLHQILWLLNQNKTNKEMAAIFGIDKLNLRTAISRLFGEFKISGREEGGRERLLKKAKNLGFFQEKVSSTEL